MLNKSNNKIKEGQQCILNAQLPSESCKDFQWKYSNAMRVRQKYEHVLKMLQCNCDDSSQDECFIIFDHLNSGERGNINTCCSF